MRAEIERASERPWLRLVLAIAISALVAFTVGHITNIDDHHVASLVCVAIVFGIVVAPRRRPSTHRAQRIVPFARLQVLRSVTLQMMSRPVVLPLRR
jgi:uncharacterized membrane protein